MNGNANDASGNGNNGSGTNATYSLDNGKLGQGVSLPGNGFINCGTSSTLNLTSSMTISCWVKFNSLAATQMVVGKWTDTDIGGAGYQFVIGIFDSPANILWVCANTSRQNKAASYPVSNIATGVWYNIVCTYTPSTSLIIYLNGTQVSINTTSIPSVLYSNSAPFEIGAARANYNLSNEYNFLNGYVDEVIVENRVWTAAQVQKYYTFSKGRFNLK